jgi:hypothetical protein
VERSRVCSAPLRKSYVLRCARDKRASTRLRMWAIIPEKLKCGALGSSITEEEVA